MKEYLGGYSRAYTCVRSKTNALSIKRDSVHNIFGAAIPANIKAELAGELSKVYEEADTALLRYIKEHNSSYVALWELTNKLQTRYKPIYDTAFTLFSDTIKNSYTGKVLANKLRAADHLAIGNTFPKMLLQDTAGAQQSIPIITGNTKYTLIDFWFTHCGACKSQFPELKKLYAAHHKKGFEIIGVSTDQKQYIDLWKKMIVEEKLNWQHYIDIDGTLSTALAINTFPRNYLLDKDGKIIQIDISPDDLKIFLSDEGL